ncbi:glycine betaine ABC transporter substrate-binding protein [Ammoniphilus sp. 3BR4]|uniref:glycine betaine ABC transporter substrate-binding protein n=1 Tax=Ammoniphilus sp. 3BR4 TaxID=3158265 RepID=UPI0034660477
MMLKRMFLGGAAALITVSMTLVGCSTKTESNAEPKTQAESIPVGELFNYEVIGVEPGAGVHRSTEQAFKDYNLSDWKLTESSSAAMVASVKKATEKEIPIVVTAWVPHWMIEKYNLKFLDDPKGTFGKPEDLHTVTRLGFKEDLPNAYKLLQQFKWKLDDLGKVMSMIEEGMDPAAAAEKWMQENEDIVANWFEGVEQGDGEEITMVHVGWQDSIADSYVAAQALKEKGYNVTLTLVDIAPAFAGVASGTADVFVGACLPNTHGEYYNEFKDKLDMVGVNTEDLVQGLAIPRYMEDINSLEDLGKLTDQLGKQ